MVALSRKNTTAHDPKSGRFTSNLDLAGIRPVVLPNGKAGFQVGPNGRVYATAEAARNFGLTRAARLAVVHGKLAERYEATMEAEAVENGFVAC
jgi:hypothetical protein